MSETERDILLKRFDCLSHIAANSIMVGFHNLFGGFDEVAEVQQKVRKELQETAQLLWPKS